MKKINAFVKWYFKNKTRKNKRVNFGRRRPTWYGAFVDLVQKSFRSTIQYTGTSNHLSIFFTVKILRQINSNEDFNLRIGFKKATKYLFSLWYQKIAIEYFLSMFDEFWLMNEIPSLGQRKVCLSLTVSPYQTVPDARLNATRSFLRYFVLSEWEKCYLQENIWYLPFLHGAQKLCTCFCHHPDHLKLAELLLALARGRHACVHF